MIVSKLVTIRCDMCVTSSGDCYPQKYMYAKTWQCQIDTNVRTGRAKERPRDGPIIMVITSKHQMLPGWFAVNSGVLDGECYEFIRIYARCHCKKRWEEKWKIEKSKPNDINNNDSSSISSGGATIPDVRFQRPMFGYFIFKTRMNHTEYFKTSHNFMCILNNHND